MGSTTSLGTRDYPLKFAKKLSDMVNKEWDEGTLIEKVTPTTKDLLRFWFSDAFCDNRKVNFHEGQKQAILNSIYVHEVLKAKSILDIYLSISPELLEKMDLLELKKDKYIHPKYAIKMATGTGKTWVLEALLIWQTLNAKFEETNTGRYSKNFLIVAPGLIVYERLLDAYLGKMQSNGTRNFDESDFKKFEELFIPPAYKDIIYGFIQANVCIKEEISKKVVGDGLIAITNWHLLIGEKAEELEESPLENPSQLMKEIIPITPGTSAGHTLENLDNQHLRGREIEFLANLPDLVVFNDEAHHIHDVKVEGEVLDVEWQKSISAISESKKDKFIQFDFSATPYNVAGSGQNRLKHYFPHIIIDFDLNTAIKKGLVKTIAIDKRKEIATLPLQYDAERAGRKVIGLSDGQKIMLRAGLQKLRILEENFVKVSKDNCGISNKHPKMLIICEDTSVSPLVSDFLTTYEGLTEEDVMRIDSGKKEFFTEANWADYKQKLFNIDKHEKPKVIVSVLMLREGFDVSNICVIVPLRSSTSPILLEQIIGRGLRLMWREGGIIEELKNENRMKLLVNKEEPTNYLDILSIIEHPRFIEFYNEILEGGAAAFDASEPNSKKIVGDMVNIGLKDGFEKYDFYIPVILQDKEENLKTGGLSYEDLEPFPISLDNLLQIVPKDGDVFKSKEITVGTEFGEYIVKADIFTAKNYNDYLSKLVKSVSTITVKMGRNQVRRFPMMQINLSNVAEVLDLYIRHKLFNQEFDPLKDNNWRVLLLAETNIISHIIRNISKSIREMQNNVNVSEAKIIKQYFSAINEIKIRENYSIVVSKAIYNRLPYPSNKGGFEKTFMEFVDNDSKVKAFIKISEYYHDFSHINYIREDGLLAYYYPDFLVRLNDMVYIVETKAQRDVNHPHVKQKRLATVDWINKINELKPEDRMGCTWSYVLLGEKTFYSMSEKGANIEEILEYAKMTKDKIEGKLHGFVSLY